MKIINHDFEIEWHDNNVCIIFIDKSYSTITIPYKEIQNFFKKVEKYKTVTFNNEILINTQQIKTIIVRPEGEAKA